MVRAARRPSAARPSRRLRASVPAAARPRLWPGCRQLLARLDREQIDLGEHLRAHDEMGVVVHHSGHHQRPAEVDQAGVARSQRTRSLRAERDDAVAVKRNGVAPRPRRRAGPDTGVAIDGGRGRSGSTAEHGVAGVATSPASTPAPVPIRKSRRRRSLSFGCPRPADPSSNERQCFPFRKAFVGAARRRAGPPAFDKRLMSR